MRKLEDKVAIVTGSSRGIGAASARRLAADGAKVVINYVSNEDTAHAVASSIHAAGGEALVVRADVSDEAQMEALVAATLERFGRLDILVNNAGAFGSSALAQTDKPLFQQLIDVNVWALVIACRLAARFMAPGGRIINFSSIGVTKGFADGGVYAASKAAVESLTRTAASEFAPRDIRVNGIVVGLVATDMAEKIPMKMRRLIASQTLLDRVGRPEDVAAVVAFFASEDSRWVTGQTLGVNGGYIMR